MFFFLLEIPIHNLKPAWLCTELLGYKQIVKHVFDHSSVQQRPHLWSASLRHFVSFCFHFSVCSGTKDVSSLRRAVLTSQHTHAVWPQNSNCYRNILKLTEFLWMWKYFTFTICLNAYWIKICLYLYNAYQYHWPIKVLYTVSQIHPCCATLKSVHFIYRTSKPHPSYGWLIQYACLWSVERNQ